MGLFKSIGKAIKKVGKIVGKPVLATVARTVVGSVPVLGGVVSAVGAVKHALHPPTLANTANLSSRTGAPAFGHPNPMHRPRRTATRTPRSRARRPTRRASGGGSAKQRAARARFAKAAKRGRIKKGTRL